MTVAAKQPKLKTVSKENLPEVCMELQRLQRQRAMNIKSKIKIQNRLVAIVASTLGYTAALDEDAREEMFQKARDLIVEIENGKAHQIAPLVKHTKIAFNGFDEFVEGLEKEMLTLAKTLPVAAWVQKPEQRGFGLLSLATLVGEAGDLNNYENPSKLWRRFGLAPFESRGKVQMGATWKSGVNGSLSAEEWTQFGYSPRRRSIAFLFGENILKQNTDVYRQRYDQVKKEYEPKHPDRVLCPTCKGRGSVSGKKCQKCKGKGKIMLRAHRHSMLLATKLLLKNLWLEWTGVPFNPWKPVKDKAKAKK